MNWETEEVQRWIRDDYYLYNILHSEGWRAVRAEVEANPVALYLTAAEVSDVDWDALEKEGV